MKLQEQKCMPCEGGMAALDSIAIAALQEELSTAWTIEDNKKISREFKFKNFVEAMAFVQKVAAIAEAEGHHPDIHIHYNRVKCVLWTHAIGGLSHNDFIVAEKINTI